MGVFNSYFPSFETDKSGNAVSFSLHEPYNYSILLYSMLCNLDIPETVIKRYFLLKYLECVRLSFYFWEGGGGGGGVHLRPLKM